MSGKIKHNGNESNVYSLLLIMVRLTGHAMAGVKREELCLVCWCLQTMRKSLFFDLGGVEVKSLSHVRLFATPWTVAHQAPPSMGFSRQEYWSGLPFPSLWVVWNTVLNKKIFRRFVGHGNVNIPCHKYTHTHTYTKSLPSYLKIF